MSTYIPSVIEKYVEGYYIGLTWPAEWETHGKPGGPAYFTHDSVERLQNEAWRAGWEYGHNVKHGKAKALKLDKPAPR